MSLFLDKLNELLNKKNLTFAELAKRSSLEKSHTNKIKNGDVKIPSIETITKIIGGLQLDPVEENELVAAYRITHMGESNYFRRQEVLSFFNSVCPPFFEVQSSHESLKLNVEDISLQENCKIYEGEQHVNSLVYKVILKELNNSDSDALIQLIVQPEYKFLFKTLCAQDFASNCKIKHILCMDNKEDNTVDVISNNLNSLKVVTDLILAQCPYEPFYFYDSINSHFRNNMSLPYLIVTSDYAIQISYDLKYAICHSERNIVDVFQKLFNSALNRSKLMIESFTTNKDGIDFYIRQYTEFGYPIKGCNGEPCLTSSLSPKIIKKYLTNDVRAKNFVGLVSNYMSVQSESLPLNKLVEYFSVDGLEYFLKTGLIWQIPSYVLKPLEPADICKVLNEFYHKRRNTQTFMLKKDSPLILGKLEVMTWVKGNISFIYEHCPDEYTAIFLLEKSLSFAFSDFFDYIGNIGEDKRKQMPLDLNIAYSHEESMAYIKKRISELSPNQ